jgi:HAD superfamily hydrolase (TIGR01509 family)
VLKALIFDMDGTLADSDPVHCAAFAEMLSPHGITVDEAFYRDRISGRSNSIIFSALFPDHPSTERDRMADEKEALFRRMATDLAPLAGLADLLDFAESRDLRLGVVTNAPRLNLAHMLQALGLEARFAVQVSGEDVARAKPDPLPYLKAMEQLRVTADEAIAFEDSPSGLRAAKTAGLFTFGILTGQSAEALVAAGADAAIPDFRDPALWRVLHERSPAAGQAESRE